MPRHEASSRAFPLPRKQGAPPPRRRRSGWQRSRRVRGCGPWVRGQGSGISGQFRRWDGKNKGGDSRWSSSVSTNQLSKMYPTARFFDKLNVNQYDLADERALDLGDGVGHSTSRSASRSSKFIPLLLLTEGSGV